MDRFLRIFTALCMLTIAGSAVAVALFALKMTPTEALFIGLLLLTGLAALEAAARRAREQAALDAKFTALEIRITDSKAEMEALAAAVVARLTAEVAERRSRVDAPGQAASGQGTSTSAPRPAAASAPDPVLRAELAELSGLVNRLVRTAADHAGALEKLRTPARPPAPPVVAEPPAPVTLAPPLTIPPVEPVVAEPVVAASIPAPPVASAAPTPPAPLPVAPVASATVAEPKPAPAMRADGRIEPMAPALPPRPAWPEPAPVASRPPSAAEAVQRALEAERVELLLQPIVTLPQRRVRYYEALTRLRDEAGAPILPQVFLPLLAASGALAALDSATIYRVVQILRRPSTRARGIGVFCNLSQALLNDAAAMADLVALLESDPILAESLVFEIGQARFRSRTAAEFDAMQSLVKLGCRFSVDHVEEIDVDARLLNQQGVGFLKVSAARLLNRDSRDGVLYRRPQDLVSRLAGFGIQLVVERVESEAEVLDLLELDIGLGQGFLFAQPRPVRADVLQDEAIGEAPPKPESRDVALTDATSDARAELVARVGAAAQAELMARAAARAGEAPPLADPAGRIAPQRELSALRDIDRSRNEAAPLAETAAPGRLTGLRALVRRN